MNLQPWLKLPDCCNARSGSQRKWGIDAEDCQVFLYAVSRPSAGSAERVADRPSWFLPRLGGRPSDRRARTRSVWAAVTQPSIHGGGCAPPALNATCTATRGRLSAAAAPRPRVVAALPRRVGRYGERRKLLPLRRPWPWPPPPLRPGWLRHRPWMYRLRPARPRAAAAPRVAPVPDLRGCEATPPWAPGRHPVRACAVGWLPLAALPPAH